MLSTTWIIEIITLCTNAATLHVGTRRVREFKKLALHHGKLGFTPKANLLKRLSW